MKRRTFLQSSLAAAAFAPARRLLGATASPSAEIPARSLSGNTVPLRAADIRDFAGSLRGQVLIPGDDGYDSARRLWNAMFDKRPALIARCAAPSDVMQAVTFAREHDLLTAVRAGGHSVSGKSACDGGIMIDVSPMQSVRVEPTQRIARVEGGALLRHLDRETKVFGLVTTAGTVSHTGAAGLTLGGGFGRVGRRFGLACDNLRSVDVVTADGGLLTASDTQNADLFWALRGGGGNFGVATSFEYRLHEMDPTILGGPIMWPIEQAREVLRFYAEFSANAPDELNLDVGLVGKADGAVVSIVACWSGDKAAGERVLQPLRAFGRPALDQIRAMPYVALQASSDSANGHGRRFYAKSGFFTTLTAPTIDAIVEAFHSAPPGVLQLILQQGGGAISRTPVSATAFPNRDTHYWLMAASGWTEAADDTSRMAAVRAVWPHLEPLTKGFYTNGMSDEQSAKLAANYGPNYARLQQLKKRYDPGNLFRLNANIQPA